MNWCLARLNRSQCLKLFVAVISRERTSPGRHSQLTCQAFSPFPASKAPGSQPNRIRGSSLVASELISRERLVRRRGSENICAISDTAKSGNSNRAGPLPSLPCNVNSGQQLQPSQWITLIECYVHSNWKTQAIRKTYGDGRGNWFTHSAQCCCFTSFIIDL